MNSTHDIATAIVNETAEAINLAHGLIEDAEFCARAKAIAQLHSKCRHCQASIEYLLLSTRNLHAEIDMHDMLCDACLSEFNAWIDSCAPVDEILDNPSDWERQNLERGQITTTRDPLSHGYGLGAGEESPYFVEPPTDITCECGAVYPPYSKQVHGSRIGNPRDGWKANGCIKCKPDRYPREIAKAAARCRLKLARHIAAARGGRTIHRDVAIRYLQRFGGQTFAVQTEVDDAEIYLENASGHILGQVSYTDKFPKPIDTAIFDDMPF